MKKLVIAVASVILAGAVFLIVSNISDDQNQSAEKPLDQVSLALDFTPNTNHTGIYVAQNKGYYAEQNIDLKILPYSASVSTDSLVSAGKADVGIGFSEGVVSAAASDSPVVSIAAIIASNTSSIVTRASDNITSLSQLDGKIYGGYGADYEKANMTAAIKNDGGQGNFKSVSVATSPLEALKAGRVDFVWVYDGWEKIMAERDGFAVDSFPVIEHGIPDYYTPDIISSPQTINNKSDLLKRFMAATAKGYEFARQKPDEAAKILIAQTPAGTFEDEGLVYASQEFLSPKYQEAGQPWGVQKASFWQEYPQFMLDKKAVLNISGKPADRLDFDSLYTNKFLQ